MQNSLPKEELDKGLTWPPKMNGDPLALVLDQVAQFNTSSRICMYDEAQGVPYLTNDARHALASCSAVCRAWRFPAQKQRLHSFEIYRNASASRLTAAMKAGGLSIAPRHITLHLPLNPSQSVNAIAPITDLRSLVMKSIYTKETPIDTTEICTLVLDRCTFLSNITSFHYHIRRGNISFEILARFLVATPNLKNLTLEIASVSTSDSERSHIPRPTFKLQYLELWDDGNLSGQFNLYDWLLQSSEDSLESLTLCCKKMSGGPKPYMDAFTRIFPSLKILRVPWVHYPDHPSYISAMVSQCTSLVELGLNSDFFRENAAPIFASLPPSLRCLRIGGIDAEISREIFGTPEEFTGFQEPTSSLLPLSVTTIIIDATQIHSHHYRHAKSIVDHMARDCATKEITVWIMSPAEQINISEVIEKGTFSQFYDPNWKPRFSLISDWE